MGKKERKNLSKVHTIWCDIAMRKVHVTKMEESSK